MPPRYLDGSCPRGSLLVSLRYSYEKKPATPKERAEMAKAMLREALIHLDNGEPADLGFREDAQRHVRTDQLAV